MFFFFVLSLSAQIIDYQTIQGKWICITPQYNKHSFWVEGMSFFQKHQQGILEQGLPYEIKKYNYQDYDIYLVGLLVKCEGCFDDVWRIQELTKLKLVLINDNTSEEVVYKKLITKTKK